MAAFEVFTGELRRYVTARGWAATEFVDRGVSGSRDRRPALDAVLTGIKRRQFDVLVCWRLDRLGRSLKHLVTLLDELQALGVAFVSLQEGIDATTPAGKLQMHILAARVRRPIKQVFDGTLSTQRRAELVAVAQSRGDLLVPSRHGGIAPRPQDQPAHPHPVARCLPPTIVEGGHGRTP